MYALLSWVVAASLFAAIGVLLVLHPQRLEWLLTRTWARFLKRLGGSQYALGVARKDSAVWLHAWGIVSGVLFCGLGLAQGSLTTNSLEALSESAALTIVALMAGAFFVGTTWVYTHFVVQGRGLALLSRRGIRGVWFEDAKSPSRDLREQLAARVAAATVVRLVDITGFRMLGKGAGPGGGLLYDALDQSRQVPVYVLLFKPDMQSVDPERRLTTVFQNLLGDLALSDTVFTRQLQQTMEAVETLNKVRPDGSKIIVHLYTEKPSFQLVLFDDSVLTWPFCLREEGAASIPFEEIGREAGDTSHYESFRRFFARLWGAPVAGGSAREAARPKEVETPWKPAANGSKSAILRAARFEAQTS